MEVCEPRPAFQGPPLRLSGASCHCSHLLRSSAVRLSLMAYSKWRASFLPRPQRTVVEKSLPAWQEALFNGAPETRVLELWDPVDPPPPPPPPASPPSAMAPLPLASSLRAPSEGSPPFDGGHGQCAPSFVGTTGRGSGQEAEKIVALGAREHGGGGKAVCWEGWWEGHFELLKQGKRSIVHEAFVLKAANDGASGVHGPKGEQVPLRQGCKGGGADCGSEDDVARGVIGTGVNSYGRFELRGSVNAAGLLRCERAYLHLPRKRRKKMAAQPSFSQSQTSSSSRSPQVQAVPVACGAPCATHPTLHPLSPKSSARATDAAKLESHITSKNLFIFRAESDTPCILCILSDAHRKERIVQHPKAPRAEQVLFLALCSAPRTSRCYA